METLESILYDQGLETVLKYLEALEEPITIEDLSKRTKVSQSNIISYKENGNLYHMDHKLLRIPCVKCQEGILCGRYCASCTIDTAEQIKRVFDFEKLQGHSC